MNKQEYLLTKLVEECLEVAQRATKALCFGAGEIQPGQKLNNIERLNLEWNDLQATQELLAEECGIELSRDTSLIIAKREKIRKFMDYSRACGALTDDPIEPGSFGVPFIPMAAEPKEEKGLCPECGAKLMWPVGGGERCSAGCGYWFCF